MVGGSGGWRGGEGWGGGDCPAARAPLPIDGRSFDESAEQRAGAS